MKRALLALCLVLLAAVAWLSLAPVSISPVAWTPLPDPMGVPPFVGNGKLGRLSRLPLQGAEGPEDVHVDPDGTLTTGVRDGRILRLRNGEQTVLADTGGRPLGLEPDRQGGFYVADARKGLLRLSRGGQVTAVATGHDGQPFGFPDDVDVGPDGTVYLTDADRTRGIDELKSSLLEGAPNGVLYAVDPSSGQTTPLVQGLHFANGVAVGPEGRYLLVVETLRLRVLKVWLTPEKRGQTEIVLENLPGFPDNLTAAGGGVFWVALYGPRSALKDRAMATPWLREVAARIPGAGLTRTRRHGMAVAFNHLGKVLHFLDDPDGGFAPVTTVQEEGGSLYLGSLSEDAVGRVTAPIRR